MASMLSSHVRSNIVGYVALVVALIGVPTAWALAANTVGSKQIKKHAVKSKDIATEAVDTRVIADGSVGATDIIDGSVGTAELATGGVQTPDLASNAVTSGKIANGQVKRDDLDPAAITDGISQVTAASPNNDTGIKEVQAQCPAGKEVVSGGYVINGGDDPNVVRNYAVASDTWLVRAIDIVGTLPWQLTVTAVCVG
jgi:hypothetical protein